MKRCIETHHVPSFGEIPAGSTWDDDSEYILKKNAKLFEPLPEPEPEVDG